MSGPLVVALAYALGAVTMTLLALVSQAPGKRSAWVEFLASAAIVGPAALLIWQLMKAVDA